MVLILTCLSVGVRKFSFMIFDTGRCLIGLLMKLMLLNFRVSMLVFGVVIFGFIIGWKFLWWRLFKIFFSILCLFLRIEEFVFKIKYIVNKVVCREFLVKINILYLLYVGLIGKCENFFWKNYIFWRERLREIENKFFIFWTFVYDVE